LDAGIGIAHALEASPEAQQAAIRFLNCVGDAAAQVAVAGSRDIALDAVVGAGAAGARGLP